MPKIILAKTNQILFEFPTILVDEFLPVVKFAKEKFDTKLGSITTGSQVTLSKYIDEDKRTFTCPRIETPSRKIRIPFSVTPGCNQSFDEDGIIEARLSVPNTQARIASKTTWQSSIGDSIVIDIDILDKKILDFSLDFYAKDDADSELNSGELRNTHCGQAQIKFNYSVVTDWDTIAPVIPKDKFVGWGYPGVKENCMDYALEQLRRVKRWVKTERWNKSWKKGEEILNDHIFQLYLESDVAGMKEGVQKDQFGPAVEYLKSALKANIPVMVGVDDDSKVVNDDLTTEHFVVVVGMGEDAGGKYFLFYDNAVSDPDIGTSDLNRLYCDPKTHEIKGAGDPNNQYITGTTKAEYIVSQVRETK